jgi:2-polyprenyl-6-hydroxyphenyl methylase/3-demethylubiquinone-9 3-methyltransferase
MNETAYAYHDYGHADPPHQPLYLDIILRRLAEPGDIRTVLDAGCGDGNFTASIAEAGYTTYGIDLSPGGIAKAQARGLPNGHFAVGSVYDDFRTVFPGQSTFDAIMAIEVIEHLYDPRCFVRRCSEAVRPGGLVIITTPYWGYLKNVVLAVTNRIDRALTVLWDGGHIKHWSYHTLRTVFEERGFEFVAFHGAGRRIPYLWNGMLMVFRAPR